MRQVVISLIPLLIAAVAGAQDRTPRDESAGKGHFGAPVVKYTVIRDQGAVMFGGRGGFNISPTLMLGGGAYGTMTEVDARNGVVADAPGPLDVKLESFGVELEYAPDPGAATHLTANALIGGGAIHYVRDGGGDQHGETDFVLLLEPAFGVEQRVTDWLHLNLAASFRLVNGVEHPGLDPGDFNQPSAVLAIKLGRFSEP